MNRDVDKRGDFHPEEEQLGFCEEEAADLEVALQFLASLPSIEYKRSRNSEAKRLGIELDELDRLVTQRKQSAQSKEINEDRSPTGDFHPSKEPVNGATLLQQLITMIKRHIVLPPFAAIAIALWIIRTHAHDLFEINPRLAFLSPERRCGKTRALETVSLLTPRSVMASNVTPAVLFRAIEAIEPTLFLDEIDTFKDAHPELLGILNSGHRKKGASVLRCVGKDHEPKAYSTWCRGIAYGGIGTLAGTQLDRTIVIAMQRRAKNEIIEPLRLTGRHGEAIQKEFTKLGQAIARWARDHASALKEADPQIPDQLNDRAADNWSPLLAIADLIGGPWPDKARNAAISLSGSMEADEESIGIQLLHDIRECFEESRRQITSHDLCNKLAQLEERPWQLWVNGRPISQPQLAAILRTFGIRSQDIWEEGRSKKGYVRESFAQAFKRYLGDYSQHPSREASKRENARIRRPDLTSKSRVLADQEPVGEELRSTKLGRLSTMWNKAKAVKEPRSIH
jgi:putative DNA primase/helicase